MTIWIKEKLSQFPLACVKSLSSLYRTWKETIEKFYKFEDCRLNNFVVQSLDCFLNTTLLIFRVNRKCKVNMKRLACKRWKSLVVPFDFRQSCCLCMAAETYLSAVGFRIEADDCRFLRFGGRALPFVLCINSFLFVFSYWSFLCLMTRIPWQGRNDVVSKALVSRYVPRPANLDAT